MKEEAAKAVAREDFEGAMAAIAKLRADVDAFFDKVTVNVPAADRRENRLKLLNEIREATRRLRIFPGSRGRATRRTLLARRGCERVASARLSQSPIAALGTSGEDRSCAAIVCVIMTDGFARSIP